MMLPLRIFTVAYRVYRSYLQGSGCSIVLSLGSTIGDVMGSYLGEREGSFARVWTHTV